MIAAGLGFRAGVERAQLLLALESALAQHGRDLNELWVLCVADFKRDDPALRVLAEQLARPLHVCSLEALRAAPPPTVTQSPQVLRRYGVGSLSEACALSGALSHGGAARLLGPRLIAGSVTCALAISTTPPAPDQGCPPPPGKG